MPGLGRRHVIEIGEGRAAQRPFVGLGGGQRSGRRVVGWRRGAVAERVGQCSGPDAAAEAHGVRAGYPFSRRSQTSAATADWVATSTDRPAATSSSATATAVWLLPVPGGPATTVTGSRRARSTTARWGGDNGRGLRTGRSSGGGVADAEPALGR